ncbi:MAG TPA: hypothetical protein VF595_12785 [Tepidisphaeraceae bacterium]|jgi:hypothetical protein
MPPDPTMLDYPAVKPPNVRRVRSEELRFFCVPCGITLILWFMIFAVPAVRQVSLFGVVVAAFTLISIPFVLLGTVCFALSGKPPAVWLCFAVFCCCGTSALYGSFWALNQLRWP